MGKTNFAGIQLISGRGSPSWEKAKSKKWHSAPKEKKTKRKKLAEFGQGPVEKGYGTRV